MRGDSLAKKMSAYLVEAIDAAKNIEVRLTSQVVDGAGDGTLESLTLQNDATGETEPNGSIHCAIAGTSE